MICGGMTDSEKVYNSYEDGSLLWLRYRKIDKAILGMGGINPFDNLVIEGDPSLIQASIEELNYATLKMFGNYPETSNKISQPSLIVGIYSESKLLKEIISEEEIKDLQPEGYLVRQLSINGHECIVITGLDAPGILYGAFWLTSFVQTNGVLNDICMSSSPSNKLRMLNHWDNLDGSVERGYAGKSIFKWDELPEINNHLKTYVRAMASIGINGIVINNVNSAPEMLNSTYIKKYAGLAKLFKPYHIKLFISANYGAPVLLDNLNTADPLDGEVENWWKTKIDEIYEKIPEFGGFLIKADSEGQPGPTQYNRTHADGANMLARLFKPHNGILIWRAFVYGDDLDEDRAKQAFQVFRPLDGKFEDNVIVQVKNGPIDFQIREPVHPLFGAMPNTNLMLEFQTTQEYTGQQIHLNYLVNHYSDVLNFDTHANDKPSNVYEIISGELHNNKISGITTVSNFGDNINWTGNHLAQANIYGYGRLAWNPQERVDSITKDWVSLTFGRNDLTITTITAMLNSSFEIYENYTTPLGCGYYIGKDHFSPDPNRFASKYHKSDRYGVGYDRTCETGSCYTGQYSHYLMKRYENLSSCPEEQLLFFHHVPYEYKLKSGKTVIQHIYDSHYEGVQGVDWLIDQWNSISRFIDSQRFMEVKERLLIQKEEAIKWRDAVNHFYYSISGINDEKERFDSSWSESREMSRLIYEIRNRSDFPTTTIKGKRMTVEVEKSKHYSPWVTIEKYGQKLLSFNKNEIASETLLSKPGLIVIRFYFPYHQEINYFSVKKEISFIGVDNTPMNKDTLFIKVDEGQFEPWIVNFEKKLTKKTFKVFGSELGGGYHTLIIKQNQFGIALDKMRIEVVED